MNDDYKTSIRFRDDLLAHIATLLGIDSHGHDVTTTGALIMEEIDKRKVQIDRFTEFVENAPVSSGVCCCGDDMECHTSEHTPVDQWDYSVECWVRELKGK